MPVGTESAHHKGWERRCEFSGSRFVLEGAQFVFGRWYAI